ncbi:HNH endonuclease family protein [Bifidobacterium miconisargentati]|uniref:HNH endonuclease family protein n=1 Tax=Bifidobacterium miconisargentati TaxID=2834437 RepID=UPI001BDC5943|nr:HNH endonuclease family protein [Bifidobacterium miconisargentati]MBW3089628.1 HNH endonuclease [Bifidobacterium miconisargentati]
MARRRNAHFRRGFNASNPLERVLILLVLAAVIGVTVGLMLPQVSSDAARITGGYTATGSAADTLNRLIVDDNQDASGYDRDSFGFREEDTDGNGCDAREDVLARDLTDVQYKYAGSCEVVSGTLDDPYTGKTIHFVRGRTTSAKVQIDHVVALENAWQSGARDWSTAERRQFGNDQYNLLAVDGPANQEKGSASAAYWLPTNSGYRCDYVARQIGVKDKYHLTVTSAEKDAMLAVLHNCPGQAVPEDQ